MEQKKGRDGSLPDRNRSRKRVMARRFFGKATREQIACLLKQLRREERESREVCDSEFRYLHGII